MRHLSGMLGVALCMFVAAIAGAVDVNLGVGVNSGNSNYYDSRANSYVEGTVSTVSPDGRITLKGYESPYAQTYTTYHKEYYSIPAAERETRGAELRERYKDKLTYETRKDEKDFTFSVSDREKFHVYDESPRYGRTYTDWKYSEPKTYGYTDIKAGDRVVVGYDSATPGSVHSMYRVQGPSVEVRAK